MLPEAPWAVTPGKRLARLVVRGHDRRAAAGSTTFTRRWGVPLALLAGTTVVPDGSSDAVEFPIERGARQIPSPVRHRRWDDSSPPGDRRA